MKAQFEMQDKHPFTERFLIGSQPEGEETTCGSRRDKKLEQTISCLKGRIANIEGERKEEEIKGV